MPGYGHHITDQALYLYHSHLQLVADRKEVEIFVKEIRDHYIWDILGEKVTPNNFKYHERGMRQKLKTRHLENG